MKMRQVIPSFLTDAQIRLLLFGGKGGVGKTSCAMAAAWRLAQSGPDDPFLLVSTDPAHSLADSLAGSPPPSNLKILELDAQECLRTFKQKYRMILREIATRGTFLDHHDINQFLDLSVPGLDELMAFLEISEWVQAGTYRCVLVDTAPSGHTLRLLAMPLLVRRWLDALDTLLAKYRYLKKLYQGGYQEDETDRFLADLSGAVERVESLLQNPVRCRFVPVMLAEPMSLAETRDLLSELGRNQTPTPDIIVNRLYPENSCPSCGEARTRQIEQLQILLTGKTFPHATPDPSFWGIPLYANEVSGRDALEGFWNGIQELREAPVVTAPPVRAIPSKVENLAEPPANTTTLLFFAGKGGVGKTTLACATAMRWIRDHPGKKLLLFSTDPAHSLSDRLDRSIGPEPKEILPGLSAIEIDARAEFDALKRLYREELKSFLKSLLPDDLDVKYDRKAMKKIMDLSPPGIDEVMALAKIMQFLEAKRYDAYILDAAPTGHLIRLLEMPQLIDQWLKVFFGLFLKYKRIFRLPKVADRLIQLSKNLKRLETLIVDSNRCALYAVAIPTRMALEETRDLLGSVKRIGMGVPALFVNLVTRLQDCPLCDALYRREAQVRREFRETFPNLPMPLIYRQSEPRGVKGLQELAGCLYRRNNPRSWRLNARERNRRHA